MINLQGAFKTNSLPTFLLVYLCGLHFCWFPVKISYNMKAKTDFVDFDLQYSLSCNSVIILLKEVQTTYQKWDTVVLVSLIYCFNFGISLQRPKIFISLKLWVLMDFVEYEPANVMLFSEHWNTYCLLAILIFVY